MLQNNYISESEGLILNSVNKGATDLTNNLDDGQKRHAAKSGLLMQLQDTAMTAIKSTTAILELKTLTTNKSRQNIKRNSSSVQNSSKRNRSSVARRGGQGAGTGQLANSSMGGWLGELSSMVIHMG